MTFMTKEIIDLKGILLLVILTIPSIAATNLDCNGKAFRCVNATHFMICVDLGTGASTTIDDFVLPCPLTTVCRPTNRFECEFPTNQLIETTTGDIIPALTEVITEEKATSYSDSTTAVPFEEYLNTISSTTISDFEFNSTTTGSINNRNLSETTLILENVEYSTATTLAQEMFESSTASINVQNEPNNLLVIPHESQNNNNDTKLTTTTSIPETTAISTLSERTNQSENTGYFTEETFIVTNNLNELSSTEPKITDQIFTENLSNNAKNKTSHVDSSQKLNKNLTFDLTTEMNKGTVTTVTSDTVYVDVDSINQSTVMNETKLNLDTTSTVNLDSNVNVLEKEMADYTTTKASTDISNHKLVITEPTILNTHNLNTINNIITTESVITKNYLFTNNYEPTSENVLNTVYETTSESALVTEYNIPTLDSLLTVKHYQETITNAALNKDNELTSNSIITSTKAINPSETTIDIINAIDLLTTTNKIDNAVKPNDYTTNMSTTNNEVLSTKFITNNKTKAQFTDPNLKEKDNKHINNTVAHVEVTIAPTISQTTARDLNIVSENIPTSESEFFNVSITDVSNDLAVDTAKMSETPYNNLNELSSTEPTITDQLFTENLSNNAKNKTSHVDSSQKLNKNLTFDLTTEMNQGTITTVTSDTVYVDVNSINQSTVMNETKLNLDTTSTVNLDGNVNVLEKEMADYTTTKASTDISNHKLDITEPTILNTHNLNTINNIITTESVITKNYLFTNNYEPTSENVLNTVYETTSESALVTEYNIPTLDSLLTVKHHQETITNAALNKDNELTSNSTITSTKAINPSDTTIDIVNAIDLLTTTNKIDNAVKPNDYTTNTSTTNNEVLSTKFITNNKTEAQFTDPNLKEKDNKHINNTVAHIEVTIAPTISQTTARDLDIVSENIPTSESEFFNVSITDVSNDLAVDTAKMSETPYTYSNTATENVPLDKTEFFGQNSHSSTQFNDAVIKESELFMTQRTGSDVITEVSLTMDSTNQITITIPDVVENASLSPNIVKTNEIYNNTLVNEMDRSSPYEKTVPTTDSTAPTNPGIVFQQTTTPDLFSFFNKVAENDLEDQKMQKTTTFTKHSSKDKIETTTTTSSNKNSLSEQTIFSENTEHTTNYVEPHNLTEATMYNSENSGIGSVSESLTLPDKTNINPNDGNVLENKRDINETADFDDYVTSKSILSTISTDSWSSIPATTTEFPYYTPAVHEIDEKSREITNESFDHSTDVIRIDTQNIIPYSTTPLVANLNTTSEYFSANEQENSTLYEDREILGFHRSESTTTQNTDLIEEETKLVSPAIINSTTEIINSSNYDNVLTTTSSHIPLNNSVSYINFSNNKNYTRDMADSITESITQENMMTGKDDEEFYSTVPNFPRTEFTTGDSIILNSTRDDSNHQNETYSKNHSSKSLTTVDTTGNTFDSISVSQHINGTNHIEQVTATVQSTEFDYNTNNSQVSSNAQLPVAVEKESDTINTFVTTNSYNVNSLIQSEIIDTSLQPRENQFTYNNPENELTTNTPGDTQSDSEISVTYTEKSAMPIEKASSTNSAIFNDFDRSSEFSTQRTEFLHSTTYLQNLPDHTFVRKKNTTNTSVAESGSGSSATFTEGISMPVEKVSSTNDVVFSTHRTDDSQVQNEINIEYDSITETTPSLLSKSIVEQTSNTETQYTEVHFDTKLQWPEGVPQNSVTGLHETEETFIFASQVTTAKSSTMIREQSLESTAGGVTLPIGNLQDSFNTPSLNSGSVLEETGNDVEGKLNTHPPPLISDINIISTAFNNEEPRIPFTATTTSGIKSKSITNEDTTTTLLTDKTTSTLGSVPEFISTDYNKEQLHYPVTEITSTRAGTASKSIKTNENAKTTLLSEKSILVIVSELTTTLSPISPEIDILKGENIEAPKEDTKNMSKSRGVISSSPVQSVHITDVNNDAQSLSTEKSFSLDKPSSSIVADHKMVTGETTGKETHSGIISLISESPTAHKNIDEKAEEKEGEEEPENYVLSRTTIRNASEQSGVNEDDKFLQNNYGNKEQIPIIQFKDGPANNEVEIVTINEIIKNKPEVESHLTNSPTLRVENKNAEKTTYAQIPSLQISTTPHYSLELKQSRATEYTTENLAWQSTPMPNALIYDCKQKRGRYADEQDCQKFYICLGNGHIVAGKCPVNTVFSEIRKQCTNNLSHCVRNNQFQCVVEGRFSDYLNENIYYICVKKNNSSFTRFKLQCLNSYHLNRTSVICELNKESLQSESKSESSSTIGGTSESAPSNPSESAPSNLSESAPSIPSESAPSNQKSEKLGKFKCKKEGKFPHPTDPRRYFECIEKDNKYQQKKKKCKSNKIFDEEKKTCVIDDSNVSNESG